MTDTRGIIRASVHQQVSGGIGDYSIGMRGLSGRKLEVINGLPISLSVGPADEPMIDRGRILPLSYDDSIPGGVSPDSKRPRRFARYV